MEFQLVKRYNNFKSRQPKRSQYVLSRTTNALLRREIGTMSHVFSEPVWGDAHGGPKLKLQTSISKTLPPPATSDATATLRPFSFSRYATSFAFCLCLHWLNPSAPPNFSTPVLDRKTQISALDPKDRSDTTASSTTHAERIVTSSWSVANFERLPT